MSTTICAALVIALTGSTAYAQSADIPDSEVEVEDEDEPAPEPPDEADDDEQATVVAEDPAPSQPVAPPAPPAPDRSYWTITFAGLLLEPTGALSDTHDSALAATMRAGYTGNGRLGFEATLRYTPFPHQEPPDTIIEAHFLYATLAPTYALKWSVLRAWIAAGAGGAFERVRTSAEADLDDTSVETFTAVTGYAAAGIEAHLFENGGPMVGASYSHSVVGDDYTFYGLFAGVTFVFE